MPYDDDECYAVYQTYVDDVTGLSVTVRQCAADPRARWGPYYPDPIVGRIAIGSLAQISARPSGDGSDSF